MTLLIHSDQVMQDSTTISVSAVTAGKTITSITDINKVKTVQRTDQYQYSDNGTQARITLTFATAPASKPINFIAILNCDSFNPITRIRVLEGFGGDTTYSGQDIETIAMQESNNYGFNFSKYQLVKLPGVPLVSEIQIDLNASNGKIGRIICGLMKEFKILSKSASMEIVDFAESDFSDSGEIYPEDPDTGVIIKGKFVAIKPDDALGNDLTDLSLKNILRQHGKSLPVILIPTESNLYGQHEWVYGVFTGRLEMKKVDAKEEVNGEKYWYHEMDFIIEEVK